MDNLYCIFLPTAITISSVCALKISIHPCIDKLQPRTECSMSSSVKSSLNTQCAMPDESLATWGMSSVEMNEFNKLYDSMNHLYDVVEDLPRVGFQASFAPSIPLLLAQQSIVFLRHSGEYWSNGTIWKFGFSFDPPAPSGESVCCGWGPSQGRIPSFFRTIYTFAIGSTIERLTTSFKSILIEWDHLEVWVQFWCASTQWRICMLWLRTFPRSDSKLLSHHLYLCHWRNNRSSFYVIRVKIDRMGPFGSLGAGLMHQSLVQLNSPLTTQSVVVSCGYYSPRRPSTSCWLFSSRLPRVEAWWKSSCLGYVGRDIRVVVAFCSFDILLLRWAFLVDFSLDYPEWRPNKSLAAWGIMVEMSKLSCLPALSSKHAYY